MLGLNDDFELEIYKPTQPCLLKPKGSVILNCVKPLFTRMKQCNAN